MRLGSRLVLGFLWLLHWLPLWVLAPMGVLLGKLLYRVATSRRHIARRNVEICFPEKTQDEQKQIIKDHFEWLARSVLERSLLFYASPKRLTRLITIEGDVHYAQEHMEQSFTWLVPHFVGLEMAAVALIRFQDRLGVSIYQEQSDPVMNEAVKKARLRLGKGTIFSRQQGLVPVMRSIRKDKSVLMTLPDQDFGMQDAEFVPFFGTPAATLTSTSRIAKRMNMKILPVITEMLPWGQGYKVHFPPPLVGVPTDNAYADTLAINQYIEQEIRKRPAQYLWVHRRFKTRPEGEPSVYEK